MDAVRPALARWLWPLPACSFLPGPLVVPAARLSWVWWALLGMTLGTLPLFAMNGVGWHPAIAVSAIGLAFGLSMAVAHDEQMKGMGLIAIAFASHCAVAIWLTMQTPHAFAGPFPEGEAYWQKSKLWIVTGADPEYDPTHWLLAHLLLFALVVATAYVSFGFLPFYLGFSQVSLMNVYVGRLMAGSDQPALSLLLGWHPWSVLRGLGFVVLTYEVASLSAERLMGRRLSTRRRRQARWMLAGVLLLLDAAIKYAFLETWRLELKAHWTG